MKILCALVFLILAGCSDDGVPIVNKSLPPVPAEKTTRFLVQSQCKFQAGYNDNIREILIVTDTTTNNKYLAITGCGVTELREVTTGKTTVTREE